MKYKSFLENICDKEEFIDRKLNSNEEAVDVIIPMMNSNILFEKNLYSFYREIPINQLLIGDGGCTDKSLEIVMKFPRVKIINQNDYISLGYCITELISFVESEWFIYLHADVYLPENWFDVMKKYKKKYDWFECDRYKIMLIEFPETELSWIKHALSGSQMGRKKAFENIIPKIDDDFLYRNEDIIFEQLILEEGFKYGRIFDTYHYHQIMNKRGDLEPKIKYVYIQREPDKAWEIKTADMQIRGLIKYTQPKGYIIRIVNNSIKILMRRNAFNKCEFKKWVKKTNKIWLKYIKMGDSLIERLIVHIRQTLLRFLKYNLK